MSIAIHQRAHSQSTTVTPVLHVNLSSTLLVLLHCWKHWKASLCLFCVKSSLGFGHSLIMLTENLLHHMLGLRTLCYASGMNSGYHEGFNPRQLLQSTEGSSWLHSSPLTTLPVTILTCTCVLGKAIPFYTCRPWSMTFLWIRMSFSPLIASQMPAQPSRTTSRVPSLQTSWAFFPQPVCRHDLSPLVSRVATSLVLTTLLWWLCKRMVFPRLWVTFVSMDSTAYCSWNKWVNAVSLRRSILPLHW